MAGTRPDERIPPVPEKEKGGSHTEALRAGRWSWQLERDLLERVNHWIDRRDATPREPTS